MVHPHPPRALPVRLRGTRRAAVPGTRSTARGDGQDRRREGPAGSAGRAVAEGQRGEDDRPVQGERPRSAGGVAGRVLQGFQQRDHQRVREEDMDLLGISVLLRDYHHYYRSVQGQISEMCQNAKEFAKTLVKEYKEEIYDGLTAC